LVIYCDKDSSTAPIHKSDNTRALVTLEADLSWISQKDLASTVVTYEDGKKYYKIQGAVEATYYGGMTRYVLLCMGKRYESVTAEYV